MKKKADFQSNAFKRTKDSSDSSDIQYDKFLICSVENRSIDKWTESSHFPTFPVENIIETVFLKKSHLVGLENQHSYTI
jgi:hypothetical protein